MPEELTLEGRVASRYLSAAFISDKVWKEGLADLKRLFDLPIDDPSDVALFIEDRVRPFFELFVQRLKNMGLNQYAETMLDDRIGFLSSEFDIIAQRSRTYDQETQTTNYPRATAFDEVHISIESHLRTVYSKMLPTMGKALKKTLTLKQGSTRELAKRLTKKATPEELDALFAVGQGDYSHGPLNTAHGFYRRVNLYGLAERLIVKDKVERDYTKWFSFVRDTLDSNYSEKAIGREALFREFSIGKLKAVVLDTEASSYSMPKYGKLLSKAKALLDRKGFGKLWHGALLINSHQYRQLSDSEKEAYKQLGYLNLNTQAGTYHSGDDIVRITAPATDDLVRVVVHEMGHRYWFKEMTPEQRARFNGLVQTNPSKTTRDFPSGPTEDGVEKPVTPVSDYGKSSIEEAFAEVFTHYVLEYDINRDQLESFRTVLSSTEGRVASRFTARTRPVNLDFIEDLRSDFLTLVSNIPRIKSPADYEELVEGVRKWRDYYNESMFKGWLNVRLRDEDPHLKGAIQHYVLSVAWSLYIDMGGLSTIAWDDKRKLEAWDKKVRRRAQEVWKGIKTVLKYNPNADPEMMTSRSPSDMKVRLAGFDVIVKASEERSYDKEAVYNTEAALRLFREHAAKRMPLLLKQQRPFILDFTLPFGTAGEYITYKSGVVLINPYNQDNLKKATKTIAHEMGHHIWRSFLSGEAQDDWVATIYGDYEPISLSEVLAAWPPRIEWTHSFVEYMASKDSILALQVDVAAESWHEFGLHKREDFQKLLDGGKTTISVPKSPITGYGGKNPEEAFCEAVGLYVAYGPRAIHPKILRLLEIILPGQVKTASGTEIVGRVTSRYLAELKA